MTQKENTKIKEIVAEYRRIYRQIQHLEDRMSLLKKEQDFLIQKLTLNRESEKNLVEELEGKYGKEVVAENLKGTSF